MKDVKLIGSTDSKLVSELSKRLPIKECSTGNIIEDRNIPYAYILDMATEQNTDLNFISDCRAPVVLLNATPKKTIPGCFVTFPSRVSVLHYVEDYAILQVLDAPISHHETIQSCIVKSKDNEINHTFSPAEVTEDDAIPALTEEELADMVERMLTHSARNELYKKVANRRVNVPIDLPVGQYKFFYPDIVTNYDLGNQVAKTSLLFEFLLVASFNPKRKFLRITSLGTGFHPGTLVDDNEYSRKYFQHNITETMSALSPGLLVYTTEPKNVSGATTYTEGTSFDVGVDISSNPGFKASYSISSSHTVVINDFDVINKSRDLCATWGFHMGKTQDSIWNLFDEWAFYKAQVLPLPNLAKQNISPCYEVVFTADGDFNKLVEFELSFSTEYCNAWVEGNWASYTMRCSFPWYGCGYYKGNPIYIGFHDVHA